MTYTQEIQKQLENGDQFANELNGWATCNNPSQNLRMIMMPNGENKFYKDMKSYAKRVAQLINRG